MTRGHGLLLAALIVLATSGRARADDKQIELDGPTEIQGIRRADVDGDGREDLLLLQGRTVWVWSGGERELPGAQATWKATLPADVSFLDAAGPALRRGPGPALVTVGRDGVRFLPLTGAESTSIDDAKLGWRDTERAAFLDLARPSGYVVVPRSDGCLVWVPVGTPTAAYVKVPLVLTEDRSVTPPGPFVEDTSTVTQSWNEVFLGSDPTATSGDTLPGIWTLTANGLVAHPVWDGSGQRPGEVRYDLSFLPSGGERRLVDLDGDGLPDVIHRETETNEGRYGFFRTRPATSDPTPKDVVTGPALKPALSFLRLTGFQMDPDYVDIDGNGFVDFVLTTIAIDGKNTVRALTSGLVTATTRAYLNRGPSAEGGYFGSEPDAVVVSDIGVQIRFSYTGTLDVQRRFTIFADGDYDGDGRKDLVIRTGAAALTLRLGRAEGVWETEGRDLVIPPLGPHLDIEGYATDFDGDGKDEIVLLYRGATGKPDRAWIVSPGL